MNYLEQINRFWAKDAEYHFSDRETALYFYLLNVANSMHWKNPFSLSNATLMAKFGWGRTSLGHARDKLQAAGLIDFRQGDGRGNASRYILLERVHGKDVQTDTLLDLDEERVPEKDTPNEHSFGLG